MTNSFNPNDGSWVVWDKRNDNENLDKMYGSSFELCWSKKARKQEIARITWAGCFGHDRILDGPKKVHPTMKPVKLIIWFFDRVKAGTVLDLFLGSGSTLIACEKTGRRCYGMELDEHYMSVIIKRYEDYTGETAVRL
jgi:DNA modification methylase